MWRIHSLSSKWVKRIYTPNFIVHECTFIQWSSWFHPRYSWHLLPILHIYSDIYLLFREFKMDPWTFLAPIQCNLCSFLLYTLSDVSRHCSYHEKVDFICHHCVTQFDSKGAIAAHMNQKGAHLRPSFDPRTMRVLCRLRHHLRQPCCHFRSRLLSRLRLCPRLHRPLRSPLRTVLLLTNCCEISMSRAQVQTNLPSLLTYFHPFSRRLPRRSNIHSYRQTCHQLWGHAWAQYHIPQGNIDSCDSRTLNKNFYSGGALSLIHISEPTRPY